MSQPPPIPQTQTEYVPCPKCQSTDIKRLTFTWWGGVLGPKLLTHVKCQSCGATFHGKTGRDNTSAITIYIIVSGIVAIGILIGVVLALRS